MIWFLVTGILLIIVEILTPSIFFFLAFGIAFILNSIVYRFTNNLALSLFTTGLTTLIIFYYFKKSNIFRQNTEYKSNISNYIGKTCTIVEVLPNNNYRVKVFSEIWTATSHDILVKDDICNIIDRKDNTLIIEKQ